MTLPSNVTKWNTSSYSCAVHDTPAPPLAQATTVAESSGHSRRLKVNDIVELNNQIVDVSLSIDWHCGDGKLVAQAARSLPHRGAGFVWPDDPGVATEL